MKRCSACRELKLPGEFYPRKGRPNGSSSCKACNSTKAADYRAKNLATARERSQAWYWANRDKSIANTVAWQKANLESHLANKRAYDDAHREERRAAWRAWRDENRAIVRRNRASRRAHLKQARPAWANSKAILAIYEDAVRATQESGVEHVVDHIVPLQSKFVCGLHVEHNLRVITKLENEKKGNRNWPDTPEPLRTFPPPGPAARTLSLLGASAAGAPATHSHRSAHGKPDF